VSFPKAYSDAVAKLRVPGGFVLVAAFIWLSRPSWISLGVGLPISLLGLALRGWAAGHLEKNSTLAESGPYARLRNPLYIGTLTVAAGLVVASRRWELGLLFAGVFLLIYLPVVQLEEQHLRSLFPGFDDYCRRVPQLIPKLFGAARGRETFRWWLYTKNREYEAGGGFLAGVAILVFKVMWWS
jgi:protein-S-isoprenylcysteine O-methyltransferase Ste14